MSSSLRYSASGARSGADRIALPPVLLVGGAVAALAGLWAPWYRITLPAGFFQGVMGQMAPADPTGLVQGMARNLDAVGSSGRLRVDGWTAFERVDLFIAAAAVAAILALVLTRMRQLSTFPTDAVTAAGLLVVGLAVVRGFVKPPGPAEFLTVQWGVWLTIVGGAAVVVGSRLLREP